MSDLILRSKDANTEGELHLAGLMPSLIVDFDSKILLSYFPEPASFESYTPDGWIGKYENFLDEVPVEEKYWIINNKDYFSFEF